MFQFVLYSGWLQLGLEPTTRRPTVFSFFIRQPNRWQRKIKVCFRSFSFESPSCFPHWRMVCATPCNFCLSVFYIFFCYSGVHHRKASCASDTSTLRKAEASLRSARKAKTLFPTSLRVKNMLGSKAVRLKKGNGGWGDPRDKELCLSLTIFDD